MNIHEATELLPYHDNQPGFLDGRTTSSEALMTWDPKDPALVILGMLREELHYAKSVRPHFLAWLGETNYRHSRFDGTDFRFGGHVFEPREMEALDCWIKYYAGPSLFI